MSDDGAACTFRSEGRKPPETIGSRQHAAQTGMSTLFPRHDVSRTLAHRQLRTMNLTERAPAPSDVALWGQPAAGSGSEPREPLHLRPRDRPGAVGNPFLKLQIAKLR